MFIRLGRAGVMRPYQYYHETYFIKSWKNTEGFWPIVKAIPSSCGEEWEITTLPVKGQGSVFTVDDDDYRRPKPHKDTFKDDHVDAFKLQMNTKFVQHLRTSLASQKNTRIVYLDTFNLGLTTHALVMSGLFTSTRMSLVNHNSPSSTESQILSKVCQTYSMSLFAWMRDVPDLGEQYHFGADYCCTFMGNGTKYSPQMDILYMLQRELLYKNNGILWLTFSIRGVSGGKHTTRKDLLNMLYSEGRKYGYHFSVIEEGMYRRHMYFIFLRTGTPE